MRSTVAVVCALLGLSCAGTRASTPRGDGASDGSGLGFKETGWTPSWFDATEAAPLADGLQHGKDASLPDLPKPKPDLPKPKPDLPPPPCPGGCDDGDPCTADSCNGVACVHTPAAQIVTRFYNPATGAHAYFPAGASGAPAGFTAEGPVFRTLQAASAGAQTIFQQTNGKDFMLSLSASEGVGCCGYQSYGNIGHGFAAQQQGTVPLYRFYHAASGLHFSSLSASEGTAAGYALEGVTVYVCP